MKTLPSRTRRVIAGAGLRAGRAGGFTLLEFIAVLAILVFLATVVGLNVLERMKRAARQAEAISMETMVGALRTNILRTKQIPTAANWPQAIANELGVPVSRVQKTRPGFNRLFREDPNLQIGAATNLIRRLPFTQTANGSIEPVNPRLVMASTLGGALPSVPTTTTAFNELWATARNAVPATWTSWRGPADDLRIERLDLRGLFCRVVLNNLDPLSVAPYSIGIGASAASPPPMSEFTMMGLVAPMVGEPPPVGGGGGGSGGSGLVKIPSGGRFEAWFLATTALNLHYADESLQAREFLRDDVSYVFENGRWSRYLNYGKRPPLSGFGLLVEQFRTSALPTAPKFGANQQAVVEELFTYLYTYGMWAAGNPPLTAPFEVGGSTSAQQVPAYQALLDCQKRLEIITANLIN